MLISNLLKWEYYTPTQRTMLKSSLLCFPFIYAILCLYEVHFFDFDYVSKIIIAIAVTFTAISISATFLWAAARIVKVVPKYDFFLLSLPYIPSLIILCIFGKYRMGIEKVITILAPFFGIYLLGVIFYLVYLRVTHQVEPRIEDSFGYTQRNGGKVKHNDNNTAKTLVEEAITDQDNNYSK